MLHRRFQRSPSHRSTPDHERRRDRRGGGGGDYNNESRDDRTRTTSTAHRRGGSRSREVERSRRERSASSISSTSNHSDGEIQIKRKIELPRHKSQDAGRREHGDGTPSVRRSSIDPPPIAPQLETSISDTSLPLSSSPKPSHGHNDKHHQEAPHSTHPRKEHLPGHVEKRLSSGSHSNPSAVPAPSHPHHSHKLPKQLPHVSATNSKSYHCKAFNRSFRIPEMDPRKFPYPKKDIHRLILPNIVEFDKRHNHRKPSSHFALPPLNLSDAPRGRLSSSSSNSAAPKEIHSRVAERLEKFKTIPKEKSALKISIPPTNNNNNTATNINDTIQQTLSAVSLKSPMMLSSPTVTTTTNRRLSGLGNSAGAPPTPSPVARQHSLTIPTGQGHHNQQSSHPLLSPMSGGTNSALSTPKGCTTTSAVSPHVPIYTPSTQMASLLQGAKMSAPHHLPNQPLHISNRERSLSINQMRAQSSTPSSKATTPSTPFNSSNKFGANTPQTPDKTPSLPRPRLATTIGASAGMIQKDIASSLSTKQPHQQQQQQPGMLRKSDKKPSLQSIPTTPTTPASAFKNRDLSVFGSFKNEKLRRDSSTSSSTPIKKTSKFDRSNTMMNLTDKKIKKKKKKDDAEPVAPEQDPYLALLMSGNRDREKEKEREKRKAEKKEAKRKLKELEAQKEKERIKKRREKEKKKKKHHEEGGSGESDASSDSVAAAGMVKIFEIIK
uniref:Uncharacterized protein n=1 Tax=Panagrolaimus superbus TaxID=310955 RepID=A0A914YDS9_9BILA